MKLLIDDLYCSMIMVENQETRQPEIIIRFANFRTEEEAMQFGITWQSWRNWILKDEKQGGTLKDAYVRSKELGIEYILGDIDKRIENALDEDKISMAKCKLLEIAAKQMQWKASKLAAKYYGTEKQTLSITDNDDKKIEISWQS